MDASSSIRAGSRHGNLPLIEALVILPLLTVFALATVGPPQPRADEALTKRRWWTVVQPDLGPARPKWRNRRGAWECWTWPDGVASRCIESERRRPVSDIRYDVAGQPETTTRFTEGAATVVIVHGAPEREVALVGWKSTEVGPIMISAPSEGSLAGEQWVWTLADGTLRARWLEGAEPIFEPAFADTLTASCACIVEDRTSTVVLGTLALRYRVRHLGAVHAPISELWAVPIDGRTLLLGFTVAGDLELAAVQHRLAVAHAIVSQLRPAPEGK